MLYSLWLPFIFYIDNQCAKLYLIKYLLVLDILFVFYLVVLSMHDLLLLQMYMYHSPFGGYIKTTI